MRKSPHHLDRARRSEAEGAEHMIILNRNGTLEWTPANSRPDQETKASIELSADLVAQQSNLFDRVFAFAFDMLNQQGATPWTHRKRSKAPWDRLNQFCKTRK
jgi:hypothetical protein